MSFRARWVYVDEFAEVEAILTDRLSAALLEEGLEPTPGAMAHVLMREFYVPVHATTATIDGGIE